MSPKYLFGPVTPGVAADFLRRPRAEGNCVTFGCPGSDLSIHPADTWESICAGFQTGWRPDFVVLRPSHGVTECLGSAPVPLVAWAADWHLHWHTYRRVLRNCDLVLTDTTGAEVMAREGIAHARAAPLAACGRVVPEPLPDGERDIDILFVGDVHPAVRRELHPWLARLARLGDRRRVVIRPGGSPDADRALLSRARIAFHRSEHGECDAGVFDAAAVGALPFVEAGNREAPAYFRDRTECVHYTADDLEEMLAYYLDHEDERRAVAEAARAAAARFGCDSLRAEVLDLVGREWDGIAERSRQRRPAGPSPGAPPGDSLYDACRHAEALAGAGVAAEAVGQARQLLGRLDRDANWPTDGGQFLPVFDLFRVEWERAAWANAGRPAAEADAKKQLLRWRLHALLADLTGDLIHRYEAVAARPDLPSTLIDLGCDLAAANRPAEAVPHLRRAAEALPFEPDAPRTLFRALGAVGDSEGQQWLVRDRRLLARVAPELVPVEPWFAERRRSARVSLCMIVRNEEADLPACLESAADLADEVVVVDTGSTDRTRELAAGFGARVIDFPWVDSFAAARNESLRHATGEWVFWLDADDRLDPENRSRLSALFDALGDENAAYAMKCLCLPDARSGTATVVDHVRLFRNRPDVRWRYRVHEQILPAVRRAGGEVRWTDVVIRHTGYQDPTVRGRKLDRDLRLLRLEAAEQPDDPFTLFNLGQVHLELGRPGDALPALSRSLERSHPSDSIVRKLFALVAQCHRLLGRPREALAACEAGRGHYPDDVELLFIEGMVRRETGDPAGAEACLVRLLRTTPGTHFASVDAGLLGYKTRHNLAVLYQEQGRAAEAEAEWRAALAERPDYLPARRGLDELLRDRGEAPPAGDVITISSGPAPIDWRLWS